MHNTTAFSGGFKYKPTTSISFSSNRGSLDQLAVGAEVLKTYLQLMAEPQELYRVVPDDYHRQLNDTFYERLFLDDHGVMGEVLTSPLVELTDGAAAFATRRSAGHSTSLFNAIVTAPTERRPSLATGPSGDTGIALLGDVFTVIGSSKAILVGVTGFEPAASSSRTSRSRNHIGCGAQ
jgi:site-specific DNA recombinase